MSSGAFVRGDWQAVIEAHRLESHDPAEWLRYGAALLHTIAPGPEQGKQQQQAALAFEQAKREGASEEEVMAVQRDVVRQLVVEACGLAAQPAVAISSAERG